MFNGGAWGNAVLSCLQSHHATMENPGQRMAVKRNYSETYHKRIQTLNNRESNPSYSCSPKIEQTLV